MPFIAYFFVLVLTAVTAAVSLDYLTAPDAPAPKHDSAKVANRAGTAVRQVPIGKTNNTPTRETTAQASPTQASPTQASPADDKALTPLYPAAPGKNLPDTPSAEAAASKTNDDTKAAEPTSPAPTAGVTAAATNAPTANDQSKPSNGAAVQASLPAGACAIETCASAYRSFRASDCTYQPFGGPRKLCELSPGGAQQAANPLQASPVSQGSLRSGTVGRGHGDDLDDVVRTVRRLPPPADYADDDDGYDRGRIVVIQREGARPYAGPRYIYEER